MRTAVVTALLCVSFPALAHAALLGVDVYNGQGAINWTSVAGSGRTFAYAKITEGFTFDDARRSANMSGPAAAGMYVGAYHFARPENNTAASEAQHVLATGTAAGAFVKDGFHLMPMLDLESGDGDHVGSTSLAAWCVTWAQAIQAGLGTTQKVPLYLSGNYLSMLRPNIASTNLLNYFDLWYAKPGSSAPTASEVSPFGNWTLWQNSWTGSVPGISGAVDLDQYAGTVATLRSSYLLAVPEPGGAFMFFGPAATLLQRRRRKERLAQMGHG